MAFKLCFWHIRYHTFTLYHMIQSTQLFFRFLSLARMGQKIPGSWPGDASNGSNVQLLFNLVVEVSTEASNSGCVIIEFLFQPLLCCQFEFLMPL
jgi:hypothetical protein